MQADLLLQLLDELAERSTLTNRQSRQTFNGGDRFLDRVSVIGSISISEQLQCSAQVEANRSLCFLQGVFDRFYFLLLRNPGAGSR